MTTDEVLDALGRYTKDSKRSHRETAAELGIRETVLGDWLGRKNSPGKIGTSENSGFSQTREIPVIFKGAFGSGGTALSIYTSQINSEFSGGSKTPKATPL